jgi:hypothetical protein
MIFIENKAFERLREKYLDDEEYRALQDVIQQNPRAGAVIPGTSGLQKLRWGLEGSGKRGGLRVIYYVITSDARCLMLYLYPKSVQEDLAPEELRVLTKFVRNYLGDGGA